MKRRLTIWALILVMLIPMLAVPASAVPFSEAEEGPWVLGCDYYAGTQGVLKYKGTDSHVTIPKAIDGYGVLCVYPDAFKGNTTMESLTVANAVTVYGLGGCNVKTVYMGERSNAANGAFANCKYLTEINIPDAWERIPDEMFRFCDSLPSIDLPDGITEIGECAFEGCESLTSIVLPKNLERIGDCAFADCDSLKTITIPKSVTEIEYDAFGFCDNLEKITVEPGNKYYSSDENGNLYRNGEKKTLVWAAAKDADDSYAIAEDVQIIGEGAFLGAQDLTSIRIPANVNRIGEYSFWGCINLREVWLEGYTHIFGKAFGEVVATIYYPADVGQWTESTMGNHAGILTWIPYCSGKHVGPTGTVLTESTCSKAGTAETVCDICGESYIYDLPLADHAFEISEVLVPASCGAMGEAKFTCTVCGQEKTDYTPQLEHEFVGAESLGDGHHRRICVHCGGGGTAACNYEVKEVITPSTCAVSGEAIFVCVDCNYEKHGFMPELPHDFEGVQAEPLTGNEHTRKCNQCGNVEREMCPMEETKIEATPTQIGKTVRKCSMCTNTSENNQEVYRISGENRFETAFKVADEMREALGVERFDTIVIASGLNFADALSGSYLAAVKDAPILLSYYDLYNDRIRFYIRENLNPGGTVYILGGESAVSASLEIGLEDYTVKRLAGADRFGTNLAILEEAGVEDKDILICTGLTFADSLSASATERPILLVWKDLTEDQQAFLDGLNGNKLYVIGGESAVSSETEAQVAAYGEVTRIAGSDRFETSAMVAATFFEEPTAMVLAYAWNFPDGLCGGALAAALDVPLVLAMNNQWKKAYDYAKSLDIQGGTVLGGINLIEDYIAGTIFTAE